MSCECISDRRLWTNLQYENQALDVRKNVQSLSGINARRLYLLQFLSEKFSVLHSTDTQGTVATNHTQRLQTSVSSSAAVTLTYQKSREDLHNDQHNA